MEDDLTSSADPGAGDPPEIQQRDIAVQLRLAQIQREIAFFEQELAALRTQTKSAAKTARFEKRAAYDGEQVRLLESERSALVAERATLAQNAAQPLQDLRDVTRRLAREIAKGNLTQARVSFDELATLSPIWLETRLPMLQKQAAEAGRLDLLFRLFLHGHADALSRLSLVAGAMEIGHKAGNEEKVEKLFALVRQRSDTHPLRFGSNDKTAAFRPADRDAVEELKYHGVRLAQPDDVFDAAEKLADRLDLDPALLDHLYRHRRDTSLPRAEWERRVKTACCVGHITWDRPACVNAKRTMRYGDLIDAQARAAAFGAIDQSKGVLLVTFHGAMTGLNRKLFNEVFENRATLENAETSSEQSISTRDSRAALFAAMRLLLGGKSVLTAPDGRKGNREQFGELTGKSMKMANGTALLAFETGCFCAWFNIVVQGRRLVPMVVEAPRPQKGERFESFAERWTAFYWSQIEDLLTGDPGGISLRGSLWATLAAWDK
ncbi:MAG TPA: hypothetical protein VGG10_22140 [Rhizomicrobium sp.]|jgi:hypothetical protein